MISESHLPVLEPHGPPPRVTARYFLEMESLGSVLWRGVTVRQIEIDGIRQLIGRRDISSGVHPEIDLRQLADFGYTARQHAWIERRGEKVFVTDIRGRKLTAINRVEAAIPANQPTQLQVGDELIVGETVRFRLIRQDE